MQNDILREEDSVSRNSNFVADVRQHSNNLRVKNNVLNFYFQSKYFSILHIEACFKLA